MIFIFFYFHSFSAFSNLFWLEKKLWRCFLIFWIFFQFFGIFYYGSGGNPSEWFLLLSLFLGFSQPTLAWKEAIIYMYFFFEFFCYFRGIFFSESGRNPSERFFLFLFFTFFQTFLTYFGLKTSYDGVF